METLGSSTPGDGSSPPKEADAAAPPPPPPAPSITAQTTVMGQRRILRISSSTTCSGILTMIHSSRDCGRLRPIAEGDSVKQFCDLCCAWPQYLSARGLILPEIIVSLVSHNALRCTRAVLQRTAPQLRGYEVDLNVRHLYGFAPLHVAAEAFNVNMVQLLLRHGASANIHTKGSKVIEGLLPLHVAVQNAAMHKYLEDHWADGDPVENLIFLLCLPEMKMFLDTTRLIAKHTDNIADEIWNYIDSKKLVPASILLLAAQKQLRDRDRVSGSKVSLTRFCSVKSRINAAALALHREALAMVKEGKNGRPLKQVKHKKGLLDTANAILDIVLQAGEALERFIQTNSSEAFQFCSIMPCRLSEIYQYPWQISIDKFDSQRGTTSEAGESPSLKAECSKRVKASPKGMPTDYVRNKFFPFWKSVLSARLRVRIAPWRQPSIKDTTNTKLNKNTESTEQISKGTSLGFAENFGMLFRIPTVKDYQFKRSYCTLASMTLNTLRRA
ncbi:hypothetical protein PR202_ga08847 [Eleusine coracana subsp. coracana]|uniref:Uncharacterized protein n=1 Tax=Eleusine coracana subsp. coracana TaxID=191504 RepID=A0AAV5C1K7_ELECO|nr:hypothetical protein PR202_ga08847 [Eleusine coracana subsp. coracana]